MINDDGVIINDASTCSIDDNTSIIDASWNIINHHANTIDAAMSIRDDDSLINDTCIGTLLDHKHPIIDQVISITDGDHCCSCEWVAVVSHGEGEPAHSDMPATTMTDSDCSISF